jgi:nucleoside-diphosphate-sugar epimerase
MRERTMTTGGAGFLGSHVAERLLDQNIDVACLDNVITGSADNVHHLHIRMASGCGSRTSTTASSWSSRSRDTSRLIGVPGDLRRASDRDGRCTVVQLVRIALRPCV